MPVHTPRCRVPARSHAAAPPEIIANIYVSSDVDFHTSMRRAAGALMLRLIIMATALC